MKFVLFLILFISMWGCNKSGPADAEFGLSENTDDEEIVQHYLRIVRVTNDSQVTEVNMAQTQSLAVKAVIVDATGLIIQTVAASWFVNSSNYTNAYLSTTSGTTTTFNASLIGTAVIQATITDVNLISTYNIVTPTITTGTINVTASATADQIQLTSGNSQTSTVGATLGTPLRVRVLNASLVPVQNEAVTFLATTAGSTVFNGSTYVASYVTYTDATGYAEVNARLGTVAGTNNNSWSASIASGSVTSVSFTATAQFGSPSTLAFSTQPNGGNSGSPFLTQPVVQVRDSYGNLVTNATNSIVLTIGTGTGALSGTTTLSAVAGIASFTNVTYSIPETAVTLTASSGTLTPITSNAFDVAQILVHAQCLVDGAGFQTRDGGCKDLTSGLVWSAISPTTMNWHSVVWDSTVTGAAPDAFDEGRVKDTVDATVDLNYASYCKSLVQSGYEDWVPPSLPQAQAVGVNGYAGNVKTLDTNGVNRSAQYMWTATGSGIVIHNGNMSGTGAQALNNSGFYARCVRYPAATNLFIATQPGNATTSQIPDPLAPTVSSVTVEANASGVAFGRAAVVRIRDATNARRTIATNTVTATLALGTGTLTGTTVVNAVAGNASFSNLIYTITNPALDSEIIQINFSSPGFTTVTSTNVTVYRVDPRNQCKLENATWKNKSGGCKNLVSGLIFSRLRTGFSWYEAIWEEYLGNSVADVNDSGALHDYDTGGYPIPTGGNADSSAINICHDLIESGYSDWSVPRFWAFYNAFSGTNYGTYYKYALTYAWTSATHPTTQSSAYIVTFDADGSTLSHTSTTKTSTGTHTICARRDPPNKLVVATAPANPATGGLPAGLPWSTQPVIRVADSDNAPHTVATTVTLTITSGTGQWVVNGDEVGTTVSVGNNISLATASFSGLSYSEPGETVTVQATATSVNWQGSTINITPVTFTFTTLASNPLFNCHASAAPAFQSQNGGCHDTTNDLVWSAGISALTWHQSIWDSSTTGQPANGHQHSVAATNDYDPSQNPAVLYPVNRDADALAYCHTLHADGYDDWRMPTLSEVQASRAIGLRDAHKNFNGITGRYMWTSTTYASSVAQARFALMNDLSNAGDTWDLKSAAATNIYTVCVRDPSP
jgi:hypothetical protein